MNTLSAHNFLEPRRYPFGCYEQRRFEIAARDVHNVDDDGTHVVFGDGATVMRVIKPSRRNGQGGVWFLNEQTGNGLGEPFNYADYFPSRCTCGTPIEEIVRYDIRQCSTCGRPLSSRGTGAKS